MADSNDTAGDLAQAAAQAPAKAPQSPAPSAGVGVVPSGASTAQEAPQEPAPAGYGETTAAWIDKYIRNGPIARNADCWNTLVEALPALEAALKA